MFNLSAREQELVSADELFRTFCAVDSFPTVPSLKAICCSVLAQGVAWVVCRQWPLAPVAFLAIGLAFFAWPFVQRIPLVAFARRRRTLLAIAIALAVAVLLMHFRLGGDGDELSLAGSRDAHRSQDHVEDASGGLNGIYDGVILLADVAPQKLVVPPKLRPSRDLSASKTSNPTSVPFFGVYWMFKWPRSHPPPGSYVSIKSPLQAGFRSSDRLPLLMQARQNFGRLIDLRCCSKIQLAIRTEDPFATLDLIVTNTTAPGEPSLALGQVTIDSKSASPSEMLLSFDVPRNPAIREFDEATIVFNRAFARASARIAIDRFVFVPRGL